MKISVIVPFWNSEKWIGRCCESLLKQEGDFEFILVDDWSTDDGETIARLWAENAVLYNITSGWMSAWMKRDGVLSSFHFNVFRNSV